MQTIRIIQMYTFDNKLQPVNIPSDIEWKAFK